LLALPPGVKTGVGEVGDDGKSVQYAAETDWIRNISPGPGR